ncbi:hypothetical protein ACS0TY_015984 [Phlomoides rotata]
MGFLRLRFRFFIEPTLKTNNLQKKLLHSDPADERLYGTGVLLKKGDEVPYPVSRYQIISRGYTFRMEQLEAELEAEFGRLQLQMNDGGFILNYSQQPYPEGMTTSRVPLMAIVMPLILCIWEKLEIYDVTATMSNRSSNTVYQCHLHQSPRLSCPWQRCICHPQDCYRASFLYLHGEIPLQNGPQKENGKISEFEVVVSADKIEVRPVSLKEPGASSHPLQCFGPFVVYVVLLVDYFNKPLHFYKLILLVFDQFARIGKRSAI